MIMRRLAHGVRRRFLSSSAPCSSPIEEFGVRAYYLANTIDIYALSQKKQEADPLVPQQIQRNHVIFTMDDDDSNDEPAKYVALYEYGAAVFFLEINSERNTSTYVEFINKTLEDTYDFCKGTTLSVPASEEYTIDVDESMKDWCAVGDNRLHLKSMDIHNVRIVSEVIAQSVALQHYESQAVNMLKQFRQSNSTMIESGSSRLNKRSLFTMIAENNKILIGMMANLGLLDRAGPISWRYDKYYSVWELMRDEFELQRRFKSLDDKISMVQDNAKFFLEVLSSKKSERLELIIIALIAGELSLGVYQHFSSFHPIPFLDS